MSIFLRLIFKLFETIFMKKCHDLNNKIQKNIFVEFKELCRMKEEETWRERERERLRDRDWERERLREREIERERLRER